jgi:hypothetical protein
VTAKLSAGVPGSADDAVDDASTAPRFSVDYVDVVDPDTFEQVDDPTTTAALIIAAARLGGTRLLDNILVGDPNDPADAFAAIVAAATAGETAPTTHDQEAATPRRARTTEREG